MSTEDHPQIDGRTQFVNRVAEDIIRSVCADTPNLWISLLPVVKFTLNDSVRGSTDYALFDMNVLTHPRVPLALNTRSFRASWGRLLMDLLMSALILLSTR